MPFNVTADSRTVKTLQQLLDSTGAPLSSPVKRKPAKRPQLKGLFVEEEEETNWAEISAEGLVTDAKVTLPIQSTSRALEQLESMERLDAIIDNCCAFAGVSRVSSLSASEPLPIIAFSCCNLPDPKTIAMDVLLQRMRVRIESYVQTEYVAVVFASPMSSSLSTAQLISTYVNLSRPAKKNIQKLYILHSGFLTRIVDVNDRLIKVFLNGLVSSKVSKKRKVQTLHNLSDLAKEIDLTQIDIPRQVYEWNYRIETSICLPTTQATRESFGAPLSALMGAHGQLGLPKVVKDCIAHIRTSGLQAEGLFRLSPATSSLKIVREAYDRGQKIRLQDFETTPDSSVHLAAALLKLFLRSLPRPIISSREYALIEKCPIPSEENEDDAMAFARDEFLPALAESEDGEAKVILLGAVLELLYDASLRFDTSKMDAQNLAICLAPVMVHSNDMARDVRMCHVPTKSRSTILPHELDGKASGKATLGGLLKLMIKRFHEIFPDAPSNAVARDLFLLDTPPTSPEVLSPSASPELKAAKVQLITEGNQSVPNSPQRLKRIGRTRTLTATSIPTHTSILTSGTAGSVLSFGPSSGRKSLQLIKGRKDVGPETLKQNVRAQAEATPFSVLATSLYSGPQKAK